MYLFEREKDRVHIYDMKANQKEILQYKEQVLSEIKFGENVFTFETNEKKPKLEEFFKSQNSVIDVKTSDIQYQRGLIRKYHTIENDARYYAEKYYTSFLEHANVVRVFDYDDAKLKLKIVKYLLVDGNYNDRDGRTKYISGILSVPEKLYLLELLMRGKLDYVGDKNVMEQLKLFDLTDTGTTLNYNDIKMIEGKENSFVKKDCVDKSIESTQKIIKLARVQNLIK